jgi:4-hydroxy-3-polyprenylbenzoate decarboxylase
MKARLLERFPDVVDLHYATSGTHFHCYVSLRPRVPGHARQVILALLGWDPYLKLVVAVDDDIDLARDEDVLWAVATRFQADRDIVLATGLPGSLLDPSSEAVGTTSRIGLDATRGPGFNAARVAIAPTATTRARDVLARLAD